MPRLGSSMDSGTRLLLPNPVFLGGNTGWLRGGKGSKLSSAGRSHCLSPVGTAGRTQAGDLSGLQRRTHQGSRRKGHTYYIQIKADCALIIAKVMHAHENKLLKMKKNPKVRNYI